MNAQSNVTQLLVRLRTGDKRSYDELYPIVYNQLRQLAYSQINRVQSDYTISRTELVHEAYLKMVDQTQLSVNDREHFLAIASRCMRQILVDYARRKHAEKRGGYHRDLTFIDELYLTKQKKIQEIIDIDDALHELEKLNQRLSKIVELRFFGDLTIEETARALDISESTVKRDWLKARGWLYQELKASGRVN